MYALSAGSGAVGELRSRADAAEHNTKGILLTGISCLSAYFKAEQINVQLQAWFHPEILLLPWKRRAAKHTEAPPRTAASATAAYACRCQEALPLARSFTSTFAQCWLQNTPQRQKNYSWERAEAVCTFYFHYIFHSNFWDMKCKLLL